MNVIYSARVRTEIDRYLADGVAKFGVLAAERTFQKIDRALNETLGAQPYLGRFLPARKVFRVVIARTPFVAYYQIDRAAEVVTILALFHGAQDRTEFEPD